MRRDLDQRETLLLWNMFWASVPQHRKSRCRRRVAHSPPGRLLGVRQHVAAPADVTQIVRTRRAPAVVGVRHQDDSVRWPSSPDLHRTNC